MTTRTPAPGLDFGAVLITGGGGFVGRRLVKRLRESLPETSRVVVVGRTNALVPGCDFLPFDLEHGASVNGVVAAARPDLIIHLAAQSSAIGAAGATWGTNLSGSLNLARAVSQFAPSAATLYISSSEVYGLAFNEGAVDETTPCRPQSAYSRSKLAAEAMFDDVLPATSQLIVCRPSNHSGGGQDVKFALPSFAAQIASGADQIRVGNLSARRDFLHVDDVIDAYLALLAAAQHIGPRAVVNVCSGETRVIGDLLARMIELSGRAVEVVVDEARFRPAEVPEARISSQLLRRLTGWSPARTMDDMLRDVLEHAFSTRS